VWPAEADDLFERLADEYRGYAPNVWPLVVLDVVPNLVGVVRNIVESDSTGRYFMHYDAQKARSHWAKPPRMPMWIPVPPPSSTVEAQARLAVVWSAAFAFTRIRRQIRWEPFPLRKCTLCGTQMRHSSDQSFVRGDRNGLEAPPRWCRSCAGRTIGQVTAEEVKAALQAYVAATGVIPSNQEMIYYIRNDRPGAVRDVMAAVRTTLRGSSSEIGLWPWGKALVAAGVVGEFVQTKRGLQSEAKDGHWCRSIFERQIDDFLTNHGIDHEHEPRWPVHSEFNPSGLMRADWRLPDGTMVEAAGMLGDPKYAARFERKQALANALDIKLLVLTPEKTLTLDQVFKPWLITTSVAES
jgi:hypothetical protein